MEKLKQETGKQENCRKYTKTSLLKSTTYKKQRDLLEALLEDGKNYTKEEANALIKAYENSEVK